MATNLRPDPLIKYLRMHTIPCVRVSSAQAQGRAKNYPYWGAVRYEARLRKRDDEIIIVATERASSDRRSQRLADDDAHDIAVREGRLMLPVSEEELRAYAAAHADRSAS